MSAPRRMVLNAFIHATGHHMAAWRHRKSQADAGVNFRHYVELARTAERAKFHAIFLADSLAVRDQNVETASRAARYIVQFEPLTLLAGIAASTENLGLIATASTTYNEPFHIARKFASLDHISGGRSGWNLVTSASEAEAFNFNRDSHLAHAKRYERAREFAQVVIGLWDSWEDDAFVRDKDSGRFFDPQKRHLLNHTGTHFAVRGPLNVARSPQGRPVIVQAGSSEAGKELAAETAEVIFTAQQTLAEAKTFYADVKGRLARFGRAPDDLKILPGVSPIVGRTRQEAEDKFGELQSLIHPEVGVSLLSNMIGVDISGHPVDGPLPDLPETNSGKSRQQLLIDLARRETSPFVNSTSGSRAPAATGRSAARRRRLPISWRSASSRRGPMASTSCRRAFPRVSTTSYSSSSRSFAGANSFAANTRDGRCARISDWAIRSIPRLRGRCPVRPNRRRFRLRHPGRRP
jgi:FMN-dependent oxidoreductase (nitrilotriacetate monooxygenase family)